LKHNLNAEERRTKNEERLEIEEIEGIEEIFRVSATHPVA
jgi:hypothetical protein